jgi:hypothetical protein
MSESTLEIRDNPERSRFEANVGAGVAVAEYRLEGDRITFTHTEVPEAARGQGVGEALAKAALDAARARSLKVVARCPFMAAYLRRHSEYASLAAD